MKSYESSAKTVEEAISLGLQELGATISEVDIQIINEGSKGLFGLFGSRLAKVRLTMKENEEDLLDVLKIGKKDEAKPAPAEKPKAAPQNVKPVTAQTAAVKPLSQPEPVKAAQPKTVAASVPAREAAAPAAARVAPVARKAPAAMQAKPQQKKAPVQRTAKPANTKSPKAASNSAPAVSEKIPTISLEKPVVTMIPNENVDPESDAGKAQAFVRQLTHLMGVDVEVEVGLDQENNVFVKMTGDTLGILIGRRGETLDALQYLTSLQVNHGKDNYTRVTLDTENYRAKREDTLIRLANRMANRAVKTGKRVNLEAMNPYERRIIHAALQQNPAVDTFSEGDEPNRHVVIVLKKQKQQ